MQKLTVLLALIVISSIALAGGEFSTGNAELLKFKGYFMGRLNIFGAEDADPDMAFDAIADVTWQPTINDWLSGKIEFKFKPTRYSGESHDRNIVLFLENLYMTADITDALSITAGQFKRPFGYSYFRSGSSMFFADRGISSSMSGFSSYGKRDIGMNLGFGFAPVQIDLAYTNGRGENRPENDSHKQFTARGQADLFDWMTIGAAVGMHAGGLDTDSTNTWNSTGMDFFAHGSIPVSSSASVDFEGEYMMLGFSGDTEGVTASDGSCISFAVAPSFDMEAGVLTAIQPAVRYETINPAYTGDTDPENDENALDFCVNVHTEGSNTFQIGGRNYSFENEDEESYTDLYVNWRLKF